MSPRTLRLSLFAALTFSAMGYVLALNDALGKRTSDFLSAPIPWALLGAVLVLVAVTAAHAARARQEGAFALSRKGWWSLSLAGGLLAGSWATSRVISAFSEGSCDGGTCGLVIFVAPIVFMYAFTAGALVCAAALGAIGLLKGLPRLASPLVFAAAAGLAGLLFWPTPPGAPSKWERVEPPSPWHTEKPPAFPGWGTPGAEPGGTVPRAGKWQHTLTLGRPGLLPSAPATAAALSADGRVLVIAAGSRLHRWEVASARSQAPVPLEGPPGALALSHDGGLVAYAQGGQLLLRELGAGVSAPRVLASEKEPFRAIAFSRDGSLLAGATTAGTLVALRPKDGKRLWSRPVFSESALPVLAVSADGTDVFVGANTLFELFWLDGRDGQVVARHPLGDVQPPSSLAVFSRDGQSVRALTVEGVIEWTPSLKQQPLTRWPLSSGCTSSDALLSPDGEKLLGWCGQELRVSWVEGTELQRIPAPSAAMRGPETVSVVGPGARWALLRGTLVDLSAERELPFGSGHTAPVTAVAATREGIVTSARDGTLRVWSPGGDARAVERELGAVRDLRVRTASEVLAALDDGLARVRLPDATVQRVFQTPLEMPEPFVALSPDGSHAVFSRQFSDEPRETMVVSERGKILSRLTGPGTAVVLAGGMLVSFDAFEVVAFDALGKKVRWKRALSSMAEDPQWSTEVTGVRASPDGKTLWVSRSQGPPTRLAMDTGRPLGELTFPLPSASTADGSAHVTLTETEVQLRDRKGAVTDRLDFASLDEQPTAAAFAADGRELWVGTRGGQVFRFVRSD